MNLSFAVSSLQDSPSQAEKWNARLLQSRRRISVFQTFEWGQFLKDIGETPYLLEASCENGDSVGMLLFRKKSPKGHLDWVLPILAWDGGPVVRCSDEKRITFEMLKAIDGFARSHRIYGVINAYPATNSDFHEEYLRDGYVPRDLCTFVLDLKQPRSVVWRNFAESAKRGVKKATNARLDVEEVRDVAFMEEYHDMYLQLRRRIGYPADRTLKYYRTFWDRLVTRGMAKFFLVRQHETILGAEAIFTFQNQIIDADLADSDFARGSRLGHGDLLKWHTILWGLEHNYESFDFAGVECNPRSEDHVGIYRFKEKWGGELIHSHVYRKVYSGLRSAILSLYPKKTGLKLFPAEI